jgi:hypothetical protein
MLTLPRIAATTQTGLGSAPGEQVVVARFFFCFVVFQESFF